MSNNANLIKKGDVLWVPYRRDPLWPALVQNCYPKKVTFLFFPLPEDLTTIRAMTFNCHPKLTYSLHVDEKLPENANKELVEAFSMACKYLKQRGLTAGSAIAARSGIELTNRFENGQTHHKFNEKRKSTEKEKFNNSALKEEENEEEEEEEAEEDDDNLLKKRLKIEKKTEQNISDEDDEASSSKMCEPPSPVKSISSFSFTTESSSARSPSLSFSTPQTNSNKKKDELEKSEEKELEKEYRQRKYEIALKRSCDIMTIINENIEAWFNQMWDSNRVKFYVTPSREGLSLNFRNNHILTANDFDNLIERLIEMVQKRNEKMSLIASLHLITTIVLPHVMISAWAKYKSISYDKALRSYNKPRKSKNGYSDVVGTGLDDLCRIACKQRELISK